MAKPETVEVLIIGSGLGGATSAAGLAPTGARILILERGARLRDSADARDARAIFQRGVFRPQETWLDGEGQSFNRATIITSAGIRSSTAPSCSAIGRRTSSPLGIAKERRPAGLSPIRSLSLGIVSPRSSTTSAAT
jgi:choline dehydrogenase-like flavoprotein